MTDEEKTSNFRKKTAEAITELRSQNKKLTSEAIANRKEKRAAAKKKRRDASRKRVSDKYTKIAGLQGLQGLQGLATTKKKK
tara:strand:- start:937 stop:1182 length:246 start_codon:yes stop_codon:yes gene_type:complete